VVVVVVVVVVVGAVVVVGVVVVVWVVVVAVVVVAVVVVVVGAHDLACDCGLLQVPGALPDARAAPPVKRDRTAMTARALRITLRDVK
jgi:hypothetical protein